MDLADADAAPFRLPLAWDEELRLWRGDAGSAVPDGPLGSSPVGAPGLELVVDRLTGRPLSALAHPTARLGGGLTLARALPDRAVLEVARPTADSLALAVACWELAETGLVPARARPVALLEAAGHALDPLVGPAREEAAEAYVPLLADARERLASAPPPGLTPDEREHLADLADRLPSDRPTTTAPLRPHRPAAPVPDHRASCPSAVTIASGTVALDGHPLAAVPPATVAVLVVAPAAAAFGSVDPRARPAPMLDALGRPVRVDPATVVVHLVVPATPPAVVERRARRDAAWAELVVLAATGGTTPRSDGPATAALGLALLAEGAEGAALAALAVAGTVDDRWAAAAGAIAGRPVPAPRRVPWERLLWPRIEGVAASFSR
ncbi:MAG TPA: hypothetical protein VGO60_17980 [Iamia sp.]|nr:hypothetical protein [Iamia sp.]